MKNTVKQENIIKQIKGRASISVNPMLAVQKTQDQFVKDTIKAPAFQKLSKADAEKFLKDLYKECEKAVPKEAKAPSK